MNILPKHAVCTVDYHKIAVLDGNKKVTINLSQQKRMSSTNIKSTAFRRPSAADVQFCKSLLKKKLKPKLCT
jgi:hypothetical protein